MAAKYERRVKEQEQVVKEDFSDLVAEHAAKQKVLVVKVITSRFFNLLFCRKRGKLRLKKEANRQRSIKSLNFRCVLMYIC